MRRIHIALSVKNVEKSVVDYTKRLNCSPCVNYRTLTLRV